MTTPTTPFERITGRKPGRYCLAVCYCGDCPHWQPFRLTGAQISRLTAYLRHAPRYENNAKRSGSEWQRDPFDDRGTQP